MILPVARSLLHAQENWMAEHGGTLRGYVRHYGSGYDEEHHGDGGELIYEADYQELERLRAEVKRGERSCVSPNACDRTEACQGLTPCPS